jgi:Putative Actinobacterial Holin-X, holin superfamily III
MTRVEPDPSQPKQPDKSLGELFGDLSQEFGELVRTQTELAKAEIRTQTDKAKRVGGAFGGAALAAYMAVVLLSFAAAWGLSEVVPEGVAFLIVGIAYAIAAAVMYVRGRERVREFSIVPEETVESVKEDVQWARQKIN